MEVHDVGSGVRIIAIDPGLDLVALAIFDYDGARKWAVATADAKLRTLTEIETIHTPPKWALAERLAFIYERLDRAFTPVKCAAVFVEMPAVAGGGYARMRGKGASIIAADMGTFHMALGVTLAAAQHVVKDMDQGEVRECRASSRMKKTARLDYVRDLILKHAPGFDRSGADKLDAVYVGLAQSWPTL